MRACKLHLLAKMEQVEHLHHEAASAAQNISVLIKWARFFSKEESPRVVKLLADLIDRGKALDDIRSELFES